MIFDGFEDMRMAPLLQAFGPPAKVTTRTTTTNPSPRGFGQWPPLEALMGSGELSQRRLVPPVAVRASSRLRTSLWRKP